MSERKAVIKNADMTEEMQQDAVEVATQAMEKYNIEKDIAAFIKREFDKKYNPTWHCIVGRNFGSYVTHETKVYFAIVDLCLTTLRSTSFTFILVRLLFCYSNPDKETLSRWQPFDKTIGILFRQ